MRLTDCPLALPSAVQRTLMDACLWRIARDGLLPAGFVPPFPAEDEELPVVLERKREAAKPVRTRA